ncbi:MAG: NADH-quinone oxidoreductase subunit L [Labilithrix sp.]
MRLPLLLAALIPAALFLSAGFVTRRAPFAAASFVTVLTVEVSVVAVTLHALISWLARDAGTSKPSSMMRGLVQLDLVSSVMLVLVCTLAVVVVRYSRRYLAGEGGLVRYARSLLLTLAAVTLLVISNHLGLLIAGWVSTAIGLHHLLTFYSKRRQAVIVAHKKFLLGQIATLCFLAALWFVETEIGSMHIDEINAFAVAHAELPTYLHLGLVLLVVGVLLKTAQLPFHGWLLQVMEAPTPVSALLHAGIVNIGGFVMIRLAPLMARATLAQGLLLGIGLVTAIVGSLVMTTRPSIKVSLAWSTIAQMGFMLVQCGLGVWHLALLHLLAHSLYKAHAFLNAGAVVEAWRGTSLVRPSSPSLRSIAIGALVVSLAAAPLCAAFALSPLHSSTSLATFALALALSFVPMIGKAVKAGGRAFGLAAVFTLGSAVSYFALHAFFEEIAPSLDVEAAPFKWVIVVTGLLVLFVLQTSLQTSPTGRLARLLQPQLNSGLYIDEWFTRLTFRLWPPRLERPASVSRRSSVTLEAR